MVNLNQNMHNICGLQVYHVNLEEGDVVITATDGLFDNLYERSIVSIVCRSLKQSLEPQVLTLLVNQLDLRQKKKKKAYQFFIRVRLMFGWCSRK